MPKQRVNRPIENEVQVMKGKWLLDLRSSFTSRPGWHCGPCQHLPGPARRHLFFKQLACYGGHYAGEEVHDRGRCTGQGIGKLTSAPRAEQEVGGESFWLDSAPSTDACADER
ncbi:MAG: hypothetical protein IPM84_26050 [Anaerolineae bacterium]|nr:hypothetical protein [Anaerolineae bacterium]